MQLLKSIRLCVEEQNVTGVAFALLTIGTPDSLTIELAFKECCLDRGRY